MDTSKIMYKLQLGLKQKGIIVCIHTSQFYSNDKDRFIKMYRVTQGKNQLVNTASQIKVINTLSALLEQSKEVEHEKGD